MRLNASDPMKQLLRASDLGCYPYDVHDGTFLFFPFGLWHLFNYFIFSFIFLYLPLVLLPPLFVCFPSISDRRTREILSYPARFDDSGFSRKSVTIIIIIIILFWSDSGCHVYH